MTYSSLLAVLDHYLADDWRADIALVTGDLVQDDGAAAYDNFRHALGALELPVHCLPGNHDVRSLMQRSLAREPFHYCAPFEARGWLVASVDSCVDDHAGGRVTESELERLDALLRATRAEHVMVCLHHPPVPMHSAWLDTVGLDDGAAFLERLARHGNVRLVVFGHVHQDLVIDHEGMCIVATPSTCRQFEPRRAEFAVDDRPPAYRRFSLYPDGRYDHELIWVAHA